ncbi:MAG: hypothetical protein BGO70_12950 [Bacteroidetes bacterium 43-93]|nr:hypothetical protein [Bacteroidota bacterium]OJW99347.1 MAG: hypothetical protein BGO70_12950 [Bacteroidetes bacterium 43-93]
MNIKVVVTVNIGDAWFCNICIASIRYYYPDVEILILKDELKGSFSTQELETYWNVKRMDYPPNRFGWGSAKFFLLKDPALEGQFFLLLDSDIVFTGRVLDKLLPMTGKYDFIISPEYDDNPYTDWATRTYFDVRKTEIEYPDYKYPGYFFNSGQLLMKAGKLSKEEMELFMDFDNYPYWTRLKDFPMPDQSMVNFLFAVSANKGRARVGAEYQYMIWSESPQYEGKISIDDIKDGNKYPQLMHWAGALRMPYLNAMSHKNLLIFFEKYYYSKIPMGRLKHFVKDAKAIKDHLPITLYRALKRMIRRA